MEKPQRGPEDMAPRERMATLAAASADAINLEATGEHEIEKGASYTVDRNEVERLVESWPKAPKMVVQQMLEQYGPPNEATPTTSASTARCGTR